MDIASIVGLILGISFLVIAIAIAPGSSFGAFIDYPSLMVVVGKPVYEKHKIKEGAKLIVQILRVISKDGS